MTNIPLAEALKNLRNDLSVVQSDGNAQGSNIKFEIQDISLELTLTAGVDAKVEGGMKWYLFNAGGAVSSNDVSTQKLTLKLCAIDENTGKNANVDETVKQLQGAVKSDQSGT